MGKGLGLGLGLGLGFGVALGHHGLEQLGGHVVGVHVDLACALAHRLHGGLRNELPQVGARVAVRVGGHLGRV